LYLAKQVVEAQGGKLIFESKESKGSTFGFSFSKRHGLD
jgi:signal transduction histidine kinase